MHNSLPFTVARAMILCLRVMVRMFYLAIALLTVSLAVKGMILSTAAREMIPYLVAWEMIV